VHVDPGYWGAIEQLWNAIIRGYGRGRPMETFGKRVLKNLSLKLERLLLRWIR
jgi:hypothetical protein